MNPQMGRPEPAVGLCTGGWTPRKRFEASIRGQMPDRVPSVIWDNKLPGGTSDQALLDAGVCVVCKSSVYDVKLEGIAVETEEWSGRDGHPRRRTTYRTPCGNLQKVEAIYPFTVWYEEPPFKGPEDYDALIALVASRRFIPRYDVFRSHDTAYGPSGIARPATESTPMRELIYELLGVGTFALEWFDHRDYVIALYEALLDARRRVLPILADSPASYFIVEANVAYEIVGGQRFRQFYLPAIEEACEVLHAAGKLAGAHLDANNRELAPLIAGTTLDFIESFTPPPDCDLSISEARLVWPNKALCCNFPSSVHHGGPEVVRNLVRQLLAEAAPGAGFSLGIIENVPRNDTIATVIQTIWECGKTPIQVENQDAQCSSWIGT